MQVVCMWSSWCHRIQKPHHLLPHLNPDWNLTHTHTRLTALFPGLPRWAGARKVKPIWILLKQETVSGSGISWAICKSAPRTRQLTVPAPHHHTVFYRPDALPAAQPTASKHWMDKVWAQHKVSQSWTERRLWMFVWSSQVPAMSGELLW